MRSVTVAGVVALASLWTALPADAQGAADAPAFVVGPNKAYCHPSADGNSIWMNGLLDDGDGTTYNVFGDPAFVDPALGIGFDPVQDADFEIRIPLSPASADGFVVLGSVSAQAFLGSGAYGGGEGTVGTSLAVDGTVIGSAEPVDHMMLPHNSNDQGAAGGTGPYEEITWTFDIPETPVPAGSLLEWVISGHIDFGNNIFLSCFENRGRSNIDIPVTALGLGAPGGGDDGNSTTTDSTTSTSSSSSSTSTSSTSTSSRSTSTTTTSSSSSSSSTNATSDGEQDTPAPPLALAGLAVLGAAFVMRRRLR